MGMLDTFKAKLSRGKAEDFVRKHRDKIDRGLDKTASTADKKTKGKYGGRIDAGRHKARETLDRLSEKKDKGGGA
ncbi:antitoxin [Streptomyces sp. KR80]|uniref:antitoxin n=1 Tax=Streptomyces sp. KR80 TaxID=3457426 RepID=UPI003FD3B004